MVPILVVLTFAACLLADWLLRRSERRQGGPAEAPAAETSLPPLSPPVYAGGFRVQEEISFHPGHAWALPVGPDLVRIGIDDFAGKLAGEFSGLGLPAVGDRLVQGREGWTLKTGVRSVPVLSPISGRVVAVNALASAEPALARKDPYGEGWLAVVRADDLRAGLNNLLRGGLVRRWMEDVAARLRVRVRGGVALSFPDGGAAVDDLSALVDRQAWETLVREFLFTDPEPLQKK